MSALRRWAIIPAIFLSTASALQARKISNDEFTPPMREAALQDPKAFTIDENSIRIERLDNAAGLPQKGATPPAAGAGSAGLDPIVIIDRILNLAEKIWSVIENNKPAVDVQTQYASALPQGISHWSQLEGWKPPQGTIYAFSAKNSYGATAIKARYQVLRTCAGSYKGKGKYLTAVTIQPLEIDVAWGYKFSLAVEIPDSSVVNVGTSEDPVAGMTPIIKWTIATSIKESRGSALYYLQGDGLLQEVGGPFQRPYRRDVAKALDNALKFRWE
ncbi:MAG TPA: hypothetical protein DEB40_03650 [Elusimicrobia bacterium]|nr:hypothetical protein [Elusimicrobiota bacterium]HBT60821.1 hypothetical protein [Elusimicrobiota bacterium]